jgi:hypothetical protein
MFADISKLKLDYFSAMVGKSRRIKIVGSYWNRI